MAPLSANVVLVVWVVSFRVGLSKLLVHLERIHALELQSWKGLPTLLKSFDFLLLLLLEDCLTCPLLKFEQILDQTIQVDEFVVISAQSGVPLLHQSLAFVIDSINKFAFSKVLINIKVTLWLRENVVGLEFQGHFIISVKNRSGAGSVVPT